MSDEPRIIRRGASHATVWRLWSAAEAKRLAALPLAELLLAVQTGAAADLTPDDHKQVLAALATGGHRPPVADASPRRKPTAVTGRGLPCRSHPVARSHRTRIWIAFALALGAWVATLSLGYAGITSQLYGSP